MQTISCWFPTRVPVPGSVPRGSRGSAGQDFCGNPRGLASTPAATGPGNSCRGVLRQSWGLALHFEGARGLALPFGVTQGAGPAFWGHAGPVFAFGGCSGAGPAFWAHTRGWACVLGSRKRLSPSFGDTQGLSLHSGVTQRCLCGVQGLFSRLGTQGVALPLERTLGWLWGQKGCIRTRQTRRWL